MGFEDHFDRIADAELRHLEKALGDIDPDELDVELSQGVLTCTFSDGQRLIINSHHAAGQIWMAAFRQAWHFSPKEESGQVSWRTEPGQEELRSTLKRVLFERLGHEVVL
jgi:CyaY protein